MFVDSLTAVESIQGHQKRPDDEVETNSASIELAHQLLIDIDIKKYCCIFTHIYGGLCPYLILSMAIMPNQ